MKDPLFTVVMPTYNRAHVMLAALKSVLAQTFTNFEFILVDDQSTDDTLLVLDQLSDPRIRIVANSRSKGIGGARNTGIFLARGDWVCQIDSDDLWPTNMLECLAAAIVEAPADVGIVYGSLAYCDSKTGDIKRVREAKKSGWVHREFMADHFISHCASALRADLLKAIGGYDETFKRWEDADLLLRLVERCAVLPAPDALYYYRIGGGDQITGDTEGFLEAYDQYMIKHASVLAGNREARYRLIAYALRLSILTGQWKRAIRTWLQILPSLWRAPRMFVRAHTRLVDATVILSKRRLLRLARGLGLRAS